MEEINDIKSSIISFITFLIVSRGIAMNDNKQQLIKLGKDFIDFKYRVINYLDKLDKVKYDPGLVWEGLKIIAFDDDEIIQVDNVCEDKVIGTITFHKKDSGDVILFSVQIRDGRGILTQSQIVCIAISETNKIENKLRSPNKEELKTINAIFTKVKNRYYGIKDKEDKGDKKNTPKKRALVRQMGWNDFGEE